MVGRRPGAERPDFETLARWIGDSPVHRWLGVRLVRVDARGIEVELPYRIDLVGNPRRGFVHGGVLATLIDLAGSFALVAVTGRRCPTVDLRIDYHYPAKGGELRAAAEVIRAGRNLGSADVRVHNGPRLVASGRGLYAIA